MESSSKALDEKGQEYVKKLQERIVRMQALIDGIFEYSRIGSAQEPVEEIDLHQLAQHVLDLIHPSPHILVTVDKNLPFVKGKAVQLKQLFQNLLSNACRYADKEKGEVKIKCEEKGENWEFRIFDNGPGIEKKDHERIFQMFQTLEPKEKEGTGIGLAIARKIVSLYGGNLWVESEPGQGATFIFTLPRENKLVHQNAIIQS